MSSPSVDSPTSLDRVVLVRVNEVELKGLNRRWFTRMLVRNLSLAVKSCAPAKLLQSEKRILIETPEPEVVLRRVLEVPGVHSASIALLAPFDLEGLIEAATTCVEEARPSFGSAERIRFKVDTRRADKDFPMTSVEVSAAVGEHLRQRFPELVVDLEEPELAVGVDIRGRFNYTYCASSNGVGGLPVGTSGRALCLLSGGIDSAVAAFACIRRGVDVHYVSFHSAPFLGEGSREKVRDTVRELVRYQPWTRLFFVPFTEIQRSIRDIAPESYRTVLYRRMMNRLANAIAYKDRALALITGENIGQVASQTLQNIRTIGDVASFPVLRPLIGHDKHEIIAVARRIGTYPIAKRPEPDCCTVFQPRRPILHGRLSVCEDIERKLDMDRLIREALTGTERERISLGDRTPARMDAVSPVMSKASTTLNG